MRLKIKKTLYVIIATLTFATVIIFSSQLADVLIKNPGASKYLIGSIGVLGTFSAVCVIAYYMATRKTTKTPAWTRVALYSFIGLTLFGLYRFLI